MRWTSIHRRMDDQTQPGRRREAVEGESRTLVAEAAVHALAPDLHRLDEVAGRGGGKALRPEDGHCPLQHFVAIEFSWPRHWYHPILLWTDVSITIGRDGIGAAAG